MYTVLAWSVRDGVAFKEAGTLRGVFVRLEDALVFAHRLVSRGEFDRAEVQGLTPMGVEVGDEAKKA